MAIFGSTFTDAGVQHSHSAGNFTVNSTSWTNVVAVSNLDAGTYMCHFMVTSSNDGGQAPSGDPDGWYMRIFRNGSVLCDEQYFQEGGINTYQKSGSLSAIFTSNGSDDVYFQCKVTDGDGGGVGGRYGAMIFPIMRQS